MRNHTKFISLLLFLIMVISIFPPVPLSVSAATNSNDFWFEGLVDGIMISGYKSDDSNVIIPTTIWDAPVTTIGQSAFYDCTVIRSVTMPDTVEYIGAYAFYGCKNLSSINISPSVTFIGSCAFGNNDLKEITIPSSVKTIEEYAFGYSGEEAPEKIEDFIIRGYKNTAAETYANDNGFTFVALGAVDASDYEYIINDGEVTITSYTGTDNEVAIPSEIDGYPVTNIADASFSGNSNITSLTIPESIVSIGFYAFNSCPNLVEIKVDENNKVYDSRNNCNALIESETNTLLLGCPNTVIPYGITTLAEYAFFDYSNLDSIVIPDTVVRIEYGAFMLCTSLKSIIIPDSVVDLGSQIFSDCSSLESITLSKSITTISRFLFIGCSNLKSITIPEGIESLSSGVFMGCSSLTDISIPDSVRSIGQMVFESTPWYQNQPDGPIYAGKVFYCYKGQCPKSFELRSDTLAIAEIAFMMQNNLNNITVPNSVTHIGNIAFYNCMNLTSVTIPDSVTFIGNYAFGYYSDYNEEAEEMKDYKINGFTIYGYTGTEAERYANDNGFTFIALDDVPEPKVGDADGDGELSLIDVTYIQRYCALMETGVNEEVLMNADVDKNGLLEIVDATFVQRHLAGISIPYEIG